MIEMYFLLVCWCFFFFNYCYPIIIPETWFTHPVARPDAGQKQTNKGSVTLKETDDVI